MTEDFTKAYQKFIDRWGIEMQSVKYSIFSTFLQLY